MKCRWLMATARNDKTIKSACLGNGKAYSIQVYRSGRGDYIARKNVFLCKEHAEKLFSKVSDLFVKEEE